MKNPALAILWAIPALFLAAAAVIGIGSEISYRTLDTDSSAELLADVFGREVALESSMQLEEEALENHIEGRQQALTLAGAGLGLLMIPLAVTVLVQSQKNANRELAETFLTANSRGEEPQRGQH